MEMEQSDLGAQGSEYSTGSPEFHVIEGDWHGLPSPRAALSTIQHAAVKLVTEMASTIEGGIYSLLEALSH